MMMFKPAIRLLSGAGDHGKLSIFIFHRVLPQPDPLFPGEVDCQSFGQLMAWVARWFRVLPLAEALELLNRGELPRASACITFDDGYADNLTYAQPILEKHGLCATLFVASGFLDGGLMWNDRLIESIRHCAASEIDLNALGLGVAAIDTVAAKRELIGAVIATTKYLEPAERDQRVALLVQAAAVDLPADLMLTSQQLRTLHGRGMGIRIGASNG